MLLSRPFWGETVVYSVGYFLTASLFKMSSWVFCECADHSNQGASESEGGVVNNYSRTTDISQNCPNKQGCISPIRPWPKSKKKKVRGGEPTGKGHMGVETWHICHVSSSFCFSFSLMLYMVSSGTYWSCLQRLDWQTPLSSGIGAEREQYWNDL